MFKEFKEFISKGNVLDLGSWGYHRGSVWKNSYFIGR